ncbi:glycoside hydrolase family 28 protein [Hyaloscypha hepaticicola]|uniref:Glycoside hydrolase family 28 protein n=1 Tax=Hyaloscypha hepaticicola TaxID=2082293 RepID=A0A2J6QNI9_9HELO|nr:glycoside hydrolase family 28 protein [Hyaloscypha hepaticicola]
MRFNIFSAVTAILFSSLASAQLSGKVGPTTSTASKAAKKVCNILNYGGVASKNTDNGPAIASAWAACKSGGEVYIPAGDYGMATWVTITGGTGVSINLDGIIYRTGTAGGHMIIVEHTTDFEFYSSTSNGAVQGYGYVFHAAGTYGPRIVRLVSVTNFSFHDLALVDSPAFHLILDTCTNGEVYNTIIRGGNEGGLDGIDVWGTNIWIHDVEVTNKDECVTVKNPSSYILIESIYCNWSGGCAIGSLGAGTDIHHIEYNNVYTQNSNQMLMIKSNGGSGSVYSCSFNNFIGHSNAYTLDVNGYWSSISPNPGNGVLFYDMTFNNWKGTCSDGATRAPIQFLCPSGAPCYGMSAANFNVWTEASTEVLYKCENAYGSGPCLSSGASHTAYAIQTKTVTAVTGYSITTMAADLKAGFGLSTSIPIPAVPTSFYPGLAPISAKLG